MRSLDRADAVREMVRLGEADPRGIEFVAADLMHDDGWPEAVAGATYVLHVASPFPVRQPKDEDELITPARDGVLRVLHAARDAGVKRVVQTSSFAAVGYRADPGRPFTEQDWTDLTLPYLTPYIKSKTMAEHAAWDFVDLEGDGLELAVVNPVPVFGPALGPELSTSIEVLLGLLNGRAPAVPPGTTTGVDARDVADLHVRAMTHPDAAGERFIAVAGDPIAFHDLAMLLRDRLGRRREARADARDAPLARARGRPRQHRAARDRAADAPRAGRLAREGEADAGLGAPLDRGGDRRLGAEPRAAGAREGLSRSPCSR